VTSGVFAFVAARLSLHPISSALKLAVAVWVIGPLPLILTMSVEIVSDPKPAVPTASSREAFLKATPGDYVP
jgi:hypothetical protein